MRFGYGAHIFIPFIFKYVIYTTTTLIIENVYDIFFLRKDYTNHKHFASNIKMLFSLL